MSADFEKTAKNRVRQVAKRGIYERESVYAILDTSLVANIGCIVDQSPIVIPMLFARQQDRLFFHGSTKSRLMKLLCSGQEICISVSVSEGLVFAKSLFHHSMNYRSVTVFGRGLEVVVHEQKMDALKRISDKVMPGRWEDARLPSLQEMKATCVAAINIESGSAKIRTGGPIDDDQDMELAVWTGVVPIHQHLGAPVDNDCDRAAQNVPNYIYRQIELTR